LASLQKISQHKRKKREDRKTVGRLGEAEKKKRLALCGREGGKLKRRNLPRVPLAWGKSLPLTQKNAQKHSLCKRIDVFIEKKKKDEGGETPSQQRNRRDGSETGRGLRRPLPLGAR